jgi:hypothetical protein
LTVRHGSRVEREEHATLEEAIDAMRHRAEEVRAEGGLPEITALRTFSPEQRVAARLEISAPGLRGATAGVDVRGDGSLVAYRGGVLRRELEPDGGEAVYDAVRDALSPQR